MGASTLLSRLDGVRGTRAGHWLAKCPAHDDRRASLAVRERDDGVVLVHCFAGCDSANVISAAGLTFTDLYPPRAVEHRSRPERRPFPAADILRALSFELLVVLIVVRKMLAGEVLSAEDGERVSVAERRLSAALSEMGYA